MAQDLTLLPPTAAAGVSADIVVGADPVTLFTYTATGVFAYSPQLFVDRQVGANWQEEALLSGHSILLNAPGTYRARKGETAEAVGFGKDEV